MQRRDRGDHDGAVVDLDVGLEHRGRRRAPSAGDQSRARPARTGFGSRGNASRKLAGAPPSGDAVLRAARAGQARLDGVEVELEQLAERRRRRRRRCGTGPAPGSTPRPASHGVAAAGLRAGSAASRRRPGRVAAVAPYSGAMFDERRAVGQRQRRQAVAAELDELADHAVLAQHLGQRQHQVGRRRRRRAARRGTRRRPRSGVSSTSGWPSITASASMPPTPQPRTPSPLIIVVCESVPTSVSGNATTPSRRAAARRGRGARG